MVQQRLHERKVEDWPPNIPGWRLTRDNNLESMFTHHTPGVRKAIVRISYKSPRLIVNRVTWEIEQFPNPEGRRIEFPTQHAARNYAKAIMIRLSRRWKVNS